MLLLLTGLFVLEPTPASWFWFNTDSYRHIFDLLANEFPIAVMVYAELMAWELLVIFASSYPPAEFGAYLLTYTIMTIIVTFPQGLAGTITPYVGDAVGQCDKPLAKRIFRMSLVLGGVFIVVLWTGLFLFHDEFYFFLSKNANIDRVASRVIDIYLVMFPIDFTQVIIGAYIRGIGKEVPGAICSGISYYGIGLPIAFVLGNVLHYYAEGLLIGMLCASSAVLIAFVIIVARADLDQQIGDVQERIESRLSTLKIPVQVKTPFEPIHEEPLEI